MPAHALIRDVREGRWLAFAEPAAIVHARHANEVQAVIDETEARARRDRLYAVGFLTYEAAAGLDAKLETHAPGILPPAWFGLFSSPRPVADPVPDRAAPLRWEPSLKAGRYCAALASIRDYIAAGDTYQVNFSYRLRATIADAAPDSAARLFRAMIARQPAGLGAFIDTDDWAICCASHELFFARHGHRLTSRPMKGTAARGSDARSDRDQGTRLLASLKNRAENLMITDMVRNDIGRLADVGSVRTERLFHLEAYPTLWQLTSTVHGDTGARLSEILRALFPAASITGAPKRRTMAIIRELEEEPREIYTGTVGVVRPDGDAQFNVAIRTAWVDKRREIAEYGVGGGIVWDSDPEDELQETRTKARILEPEPEPEFSLIETLLWEPDRGYWLLTEHLDRLQAAARYFFDEQAAPRAVVRRLEDLARGFEPVPHRVRLLLDPRLDVHVSAAPLRAADQPTRVALAQSPARLTNDPFVAHKTTRRDIYETARRETAAAVPEADDVLLINERGEVTESTIANVVVDLDGVLVTPPASAGLLPGVCRRHLLETGRVVERRLLPEHLRTARAIYLANSVRGLWQVKLVGN